MSRRKAEGQDRAPRQCVQADNTGQQQTNAKQTNKLTERGTNSSKEREGVASHDCTPSSGPRRARGRCCTPCEAEQQKRRQQHHSNSNSTVPVARAPLHARAYVCNVRCSRATGNVAAAGTHCTSTLTTTQHRASTRSKIAPTSPRSGTLARTNRNWRVGAREKKDEGGANNVTQDQQDSRHPPPKTIQGTGWGTPCRGC